MKFKTFANGLYNKYSSKNKSYIIITIALLFILIILVGIKSLNTTTDPDAYDVAAYLGEANFISTHGGVLNFLNLCLTGSYKEANQHPLYILFLTPFASTDISFFITAKFISFIFGIATLVFLFLIGRKMFGDLVAFFAVTAMIFNSVFLEWTTLVACESLLTLLSMLCIYFIIEGFKDNINWLYAGILAGLSFLTKASGLFLIPGFVLSAFVVYKFQVLKNKYFWSFFIFFTIISSPLLIRNIVVYGDPFFNVNKYVVEMGEEGINKYQYYVFDPNMGAGLWRFDKVEFSNSNNIDDNSDFNLNKTTDFVKSLVSESFIFLDAINISFIKDLSWNAEIFFSVIFIILFFIGLSREKMGIKIYILTTFLVLLVALSFNPISRYFLPIIPFIWLYIAFGMFTVIDLFNKNFLKKSPKKNIILFIQYFLVVFLVLNIGYILSQKKISNPFQSVDYNENRTNLVKWVRSNIHEKEKYTLGPNINWQLDKGICILPPIPARENLPKLNSFMKNHGIEYVIIYDKILNSYKGIDYNKWTQTYFRWDSTLGITMKRKINKWTLVYKNPKKPAEYLVYKVDQ